MEKVYKKVYGIQSTVNEHPTASYDEKIEAIMASSKEAYNQLNPGCMTQQPTSMDQPNFDFLRRKLTASQIKKLKSFNLNLN
jgi:hypothetical protein